MIFIILLFTPSSIRINGTKYFLYSFLIHAQAAMIKRFLFNIILVFFIGSTSAQKNVNYPTELIRKGWTALVVDNDTLAVECFELAYEQALKNKDTEATAEALLHLGMTYYGVSTSKGLEYCFSAMAEFKKFESTDPQKAFKGRCRCLQLLSTIYGRQGKFNEVIHLSHEALPGFPERDSSGYRGLIFTSLATAYTKLNRLDSADYYYRKALSEQLLARNFVYLPSAYSNVANLELKNGREKTSRELYHHALSVADSTGNQQAQVTSLLGLGKWQLRFGNKDTSEFLYFRAQKIAAILKDKSFYLKVVEALLALKKEEKDFQKALSYQEEISTVRDSMYSYDKHKLVKNLEVQFNVAEKDRKLTLLQKERDIALLSNYLLAASIVFIILLAFFIIFFQRRTHARDKLVLQAKEALVTVLEEQKKIREQFLQNEIEFKESQLSGLALQMMQKNNLLQELKEQLEENEKDREDKGLKKLINKGLNQDKDWTDFNRSFESLNKNFYSRLKELYPDISQNDLKLCALIKLNLSIKEMAGILNISPDSVKTARYRLRKKLELSTEDNLTEFILKL